MKGKDGSLSAFRQLNTGVPQGSVLGPLLFSLYINDISRYLDTGISRIIYADDIQIYAPCHISELQHLLDRVSANADH